MSGKAEKAKIRPDKDSNPLHAWRYVKIVPTVPAVPTFQTIRAKTEKNTPDIFSYSNGIAKKPGTSGTPGTKADVKDAGGDS